MSANLEEPGWSATPFPAIRPAMRADAPLLAALLAQCMKQPWSADMVASALGLRGVAGLIAFRRDAHGEPVAQEAPFTPRGASGEGEVIGTVLVQVVAPEVEVLQLAVVHHDRRHGLGRHLLELGLALAAGRGATDAYLEVRVGNTPARGLYRKAGFAEVARRRHYYQDGEDALVLARKLGP